MLKRVGEVGNGVLAEKEIEKIRTYRFTCFFFEFYLFFSFSNFYDRFF